MPLLLRLCWCWILLLPVSSLLAQTPERTLRGHYVPVNLSLIPSVSLNRLVSERPERDVYNTISLGVLGSKAARLEGIALAGGWTSISEEVGGVMVAGLANVAGENLHGGQLAGLANVVGAGGSGIQAAGLANVAGEAFGGIQASGLANVTGDAGWGAQVAGFANIIGEGASAGQVAGFANIAGGAMGGAQVAGFANVAGENAWGAQVAGFANVAGETLHGAQVAGFVNVAGEQADVQVAGFANVTGEEMRGLQVAGLANVAPVVRGVQVAPFNRAEEHTGLPIGLVSYVDRVGLHLDTWVDETGALLSAVRSGNRWFSNFAGVRARLLGDEAYRWGWVGGLGIHQALGDRTYGTLDAMYHQLVSQSFRHWDQRLVRLRATVGYRFSDRLALFGGPSLTALFSDEDGGGDLAPWSIYERAWSRTSVQVWPGFALGVRTRIRAPRERMR
ncbi:MAG: hypothetical protein ACR2GR_05105 [Rhodothermales bacterium]